MRTREMKRTLKAMESIEKVLIPYGKVKRALIIKLVAILYGNKEAGK